MNSTVEEMELETCNVKHDEAVVELFKIYPHDIQMYKNPPTGQISLAEFETLGSERLEVLRIIDRLSKEIEIKPEEFKDCLLNALKSKGLDYYVKLIKSPGCNSNTLEDIEARKRDHTSHFILRFSLCKKAKTLDWFIKMEEKLFRMKFDSLNRDGFEKFLTLNNFCFPTLSEEEKHENRENLVAVHEDIDVDNTVFYKVPYLCLRNLVKTRKTFINRGIAFVPSTDMIHVVSQSFKDYLNQEINSSRSAITKDSRLEPIFKNLFTFTENILLYEPNSIPLDSLDELSNTSYPLCMKIMHQALRKEHHLKNGGRFQYGLFLKIIGINFESAVNFWKEEFLQKMDLQTFEQQHLYNIKHVYGKVGRRMNYRFLSCNTIIASRVGFGEYHGCPYKNMTEDTLHTYLKKLGLEDDGIIEIEDLAKNNRYREACSKCFHQTHKIALADMIVSPANYFFCSQDQILRRKSIKKREEKNLLEKEEANKESVQPDLAMERNPMELSN